MRKASREVGFLWFICGGKTLVRAKRENMDSIINAKNLIEYLEFYQNSCIFVPKL